MCTAVVVYGKGSYSGKPMLMKHRDIPYDKRNHAGSFLRYFQPTKGFRVLFVTDSLSHHSFLPLCGLNEVGFTLLNTASFNLGLRDFSCGTSPVSIMAQALVSCQCADDFASVLKSQRKGMVPANYLIADRLGNVSLFEVSKSNWTRVDNPDFECGFYAFTNFSQSGDLSNQAGLERCLTARKIMSERLEGNVPLTPHDMVDSISRSLRSELLQVDFRSQHWQGGDYFPDGSFIPLKSTTFSVSFCGDVIWCALGYPPVTPLLPIPFGTPIPAILDEISSFSVAMRNCVFDVNYGEGNRYINIKRLFNNGGSGFIQRLASIEEWAVSQFDKMREQSSLDSFYQQYSQRIRDVYKMGLTQPNVDDAYSSYRLCQFDEKKDLASYGRNVVSRLFCRKG